MRPARAALPPPPTTPPSLPPRLRPLRTPPPRRRAPTRGNTLRRSSSDLDDIDDGPFLARRARHAHWIALHVLPVGDHEDDAAVIVRLGIARQKLTPPRDGARNGGASHGHVVGLEL